MNAAPGGFTGGEAVVFTGDTLFAGSVGGVRAPGHTTYTDLKDSIMGTLMELPADTVIHPGHADASTVGREWEHNRSSGSGAAWIRRAPSRAPRSASRRRSCCSCDDYDGGTKAWVRWPSGIDDIVPGSQVQRAEPAPRTPFR